MEPLVTSSGDPYSAAERRNLATVEQFFTARDLDRTTLFADDGVWWNGLPMIPGAEGQTEHRGIDAIRKILPSQRSGPLPPGRDSYVLSTNRFTDVVVLADGDHVVRQHTQHSETTLGRQYVNVYCFVFRFDHDGKIAYLTEHWNTWHAHRVLFENFTVEPAHPEGDHA
jgi:ketosteroid isomerase-like protein